MVNFAVCVSKVGYHIPFTIHSISVNINSVFEALDPAWANVEHVGAASLSNAKSAPIVESKGNIVDDQREIR